MAKPDDLPVWSTDDNYPAGTHSWNETPTKIAPIAGRIAKGFEPRGRPPAQELNWQLNLLGQWFEYFDDLGLDADTRIIFPRPHKSTNWAFDGDISADLDVALLSSGAGDVDICLSDYMRRGQTLKDVRLWLQGDDAVDVTATVYKHDFGSAVTPEGTATENNVSSVGTTFLDINDVNIEFTNELIRIWLRVSASAAGARFLVIVPEFAPVP